MKVKSVEKLEKSRVALTSEASAEEFEAALNKAYLKERNRIMLPGFRKGKAPRKMIEAMYGAEIFYEEAVNLAYPDLFDQAVEQKKLDTVAYPDVELLEANKDGFTFKATVAVRPEVKLGKYKGLTAPMDVEKVTEKDIDEEMKPYIQRATRMVDVDRKAKKGDTVNINFEGFMDGKAFDGGKGENHDLELGSGMFIPGFEDQLVGVKADADKDVVVTFPEDYGAKELAGKEATFKVKVNAVKGLTVHKALEVDVDRVALLGLPVHIHHPGGPLDVGLHLLINVFLGDFLHILGGGQALIFAQLDLGADSHRGFECKAILIGLQQLHIGISHGIQLLLLHSLIKEVGIGQIHRLLIEDLGAVHGLDHLPGGLALPEPREHDTVPLL